MTTVKVDSEELQACRICLSTDIKLYSIYEHRLDEAFVELMGTSLSVWDGLPQHLCTFCRSQLLKCSNLRERCLRAQDLLKQALLHQSFISTDFVRTVDRTTNQLNYNLTIHLLNNIEEYTHNETHSECHTEPYADYPEDKQINNESLNTIYNDDDAHDFDIEDVLIKDDVESEEKDIKTISNDDDDDIPLKILKMRPIKKEIVEQVKKEKIPKKVKTRKVAKGEKAQFTRKKKGFKRFFSCEEDYVKFELNYNISIVKVSEEEQKKEMENRKLSANYARAHLRCDKCYKGFLSDATFENHQKVHDPSMGANECQLCQARFKHPTRLRRHMETHTLKFMCKLCPLVTRHRGMAMMHSDFHSGKTFECKYCGLTFKKKTTFNTHIRVQHPLENASGGACDVCGETFIGRRGLMQHKTMAHRKLPIPELKCSACGVQFENLDAVVRHAACDPALRACAQCGESFPDEARLAAHALLAHVAPRHSCDECDKSFATKSSLGTHVDRVHLKIKPKKTGFYKYHLYPKKIQNKRIEEICEICGKGYPSSTWLKYHQRTHTGERPYKCTECPKSYMTPAALQSHSVSHTGVRRWQCSQCPKTFLHQSSIYKHKLVHTGEKPFECHICNKSFTQSGSLATHVKYVHMKLKPPPRRRRRDDVTH